MTITIDDVDDGMCDGVPKLVDDDKFTLGKKPSKYLKYFWKETFSINFKDEYSLLTRIAFKKASSVISAKNKKIYWCDLSILRISLKKCDLGSYIFSKLTFEHVKQSWGFAIYYIIEKLVYLIGLLHTFNNWMWRGISLKTKKYKLIRLSIWIK